MTAFLWEDQLVNLLSRLLVHPQPSEDGSSGPTPEELEQRVRVNELHLKLLENRLAVVEAELKSPRQKTRHRAS